MMTSCCGLIKNAQILIQLSLWKYLRKLFLQTWHHQSKTKGEQNDTCHAVPITTVLLLVLCKYYLKFPCSLQQKSATPKNLSRNLFDNVEGTSVPIGTSLSRLEVASWDIFLDGKRLEPSRWPWQQATGFILFSLWFESLVPSLKSTTPIFSAILLNLSICAFLISTQHDVIMLLICIIQKCQYLQNEKRYSKKENSIELYIEKPFKKATKVFHIMCTLNSNIKSKRCYEHMNYEYTTVKQM